MRGLDERLGSPLNSSKISASLCLAHGTLSAGEDLGASRSDTMPRDLAVISLDDDAVNPMLRDRRNRLRK